MFAFNNVEEYHSQLKSGSITCVQAVHHYLDKISSAAHLNAFIEVFAEEALQRAEELDDLRNKGKFSGKLHGVVIGLKDVICYKDHQLTASSGILKGFRSLFSATAVERLLLQGAIIIGNLNCDEFAMGSSSENSVYGRVMNALDESRVPGGSSGGSAVAVQAGLCMISLGSDTGGSVRQPADFCGIIGLKPTYGRISRHGLIAYASSFDQIGIFGTSVEDIALTLEVMAGPDEFDSSVAKKIVPSYTSLLNTDKKFRFVYFNEAIDHPSLDREIANAIKSKLNELNTTGHKVSATGFDLMDYIVPAYYILTTAEASSNLSRYDSVRFGYRSKEPVTGLADFYKRNRTEGFGKEVKRRIMLGTFVLSAGYYDAYFTKAQKVRRLVNDRIAEIFKNYDFIILPASPVTAFKAGEKMDDPVSMYLADIYTVMANLAGCPAISLPLFRHSNGMPFGLQIMSARFDEVSLLQAARMLMQGNE